MILLAIVLITLIGAVALALVAKAMPGYVLISVGAWTVETTLALTVVALIVLFVLLYALFRLASRLRNVPPGIGAWRQQRRDTKAIRALNHGLIELAEGDWAAAERDVIKHAQQGKTPLLNYLAAARAAQAQGADERRDRYLQLAHEQAPAADIAVGLTQAELQLAQQQHTQALATLQQLHQTAPKHPQVLKRLASLYCQLADWDNFLALLPTLRKRQLFTQEELNRLSHSAYLALLNASTGSPRPFWNRLPKEWRQDEKLVACYVEKLIAAAEGDLAESVLRVALRQQRSPLLLRQYGLIQGPDSGNQLAFAESFLRGHENDATTLLSCGRLCLRHRLWGKARDYFEASIQAHPSLEACNELAHLLEQLDQPEIARDYYRQGLSLAPDCPVAISQTLVME